jgi:hypothetical protein
MDFFDLYCKYLHFLLTLKPNADKAAGKNEKYILKICLGDCILSKKSVLLYPILHTLYIQGVLYLAH